MINNPRWGSSKASYVESVDPIEHRADATAQLKMLTFPDLAIILVVLALNLFGDGTRDALDRRTGTKTTFGQPDDSHHVAQSLTPARTGHSMALPDAEARRESRCVVR